MKNNIPNRFFIIFFHHRSGSGWLSDMLNSHPDIASYNEIALRDHGFYQKNTHLFGKGFDPQKVLVALEDMDPEAKLHGFKLGKMHLKPKLTIPLVSSVNKVIITKRITTEALASVEQVELTRIFNIKKTFLSKDRLTELINRCHQPITIDIDNAKKIIKKWEAEIRFFENVLETTKTPCKIVDYVDLYRDTAATVSSVLKFLEVPDMPLYSSFIKLHTSYSFVKNIDEVNRAFGPRYGYLKA